MDIREEVLINPIFLVEENAERLRAVLAAVQGQSSVNLIDFATLETLARRAEVYLEALRLPKGMRANATLAYHAAGPSANAYQYGQGATRVHLVRKSKGWYLGRVARIKVFPRQSELFHVSVTQQMKDEAIRRFSDNIAVLSLSLASLTAADVADGVVQSGNTREGDQQ